MLTLRRALVPASAVLALSCGRSSVPVSAPEASQTLSAPLPFTATETLTGAAPSCRAGNGAKGVQTKWVQAAGQWRSYVLAVPAGYQGDKAQPLVVAYHGTSQNGSWMRGLVGGLEREAKGAGLFVYPDALKGAFGGAGDVQFFDAIVADMKRSYCVDAQRIFAVGFSNGAYFINQLAAERPNILRAIAPASGGGGGNSGGMAVWIAHGNHDSWVNVGQGRDSRDRWARANSCTSKTQPSARQRECVTYQGCSAGHPVVWCEWNGDHNWAPFADRAVWAFFSSL